MKKKELARRRGGQSGDSFPKGEGKFHAGGVGGGSLGGRDSLTVFETSGDGRTRNPAAHKGSLLIKGVWKPTSVKVTDPGRAGEEAKEKFGSEREEGS